MYHLMGPWTEQAILIQFTDEGIRAQRGQVACEETVNLNSEIVFAFPTLRLLFPKDR